jgi:hypothetical protein
MTSRLSNANVKPEGKGYLFTSVFTYQSEQDSKDTDRDSKNQTGKTWIRKHSRQYYTLPLNC